MIYSAVLGKFRNREQLLVFISLLPCTMPTAPRCTSAWPPIPATWPHPERNHSCAPWFAPDRFPLAPSELATRPFSLCVRHERRRGRLPVVPFPGCARPSLGPAPAHSCPDSPVPLPWPIKGQPGPLASAQKGRQPPLPAAAPARRQTPFPGLPPPNRPPESLHVAPRKLPS